METVKAGPSSSKLRVKTIEEIDEDYINQKFPDEFDVKPVENEVEEEPPDCAICLEQLTDRSFTNSCLHMFCFNCLQSWSKIKAECPLCKQSFFSIIHNIRTMTDYDEYHVPPPEPRLYTNPEITPNFLARASDFPRNFLSSYSTMLVSSRLAAGRSGNLLIQPYVDNSEIQANFSPLNSTGTQLRCNRRDIYTKDLQTMPPATYRYRESSPEFYRENESQIHRLVRWLQRELIVLSLLTRSFSWPELVRIIVDMLPMYSINSTTFFNTVNRYLGVYTARFVNEFYRFATSPFELEQYDRDCMYVRQRPDSQLSFIVHVGRDDSEDVQVIPNAAPSTSFTPWIDVNDLGQAHSSASTSHQNPVPSSSGVFVPNCQPSTSSATPPFWLTHSVIDLSDSDTENDNDDADDDCVIIDQVPKAETIVLDDSDDEESPIPAVPEAAASVATPSASFLTIDLTSNVDSSLDQVTPAVKNEDDDVAQPTAEENDSSVLSTDASSNENMKSENNKRKRSTKCYRVRKLQKISRNRIAYSGAAKDLYHLTDSSSVETDQDDSDWESSRKRRKRTKRVHSRRVPKGRKVQKVQSEEPAMKSEEDSSNVYPTYVVDEESDVEDLLKNRLRSVVKKIKTERSETYATKPAGRCSCSDSGLLLNEPSTSKQSLYGQHFATCRFYSRAPWNAVYSNTSDSD